MSISRIDKLVCEILKCDSITNAASLRSIDIDIFVAADRTGKSAQMAAAAVSLALRTFVGAVRVHLPSAVAGLNWDKRSLAELLRYEAQSFGSPHRLQINPTVVGKWQLGLGVNVECGITADAEGWVAAVNHVFPGQNGCATPAAVFATCCAFAKLFAFAALGQDEFAKERWDLNLLDFTPSDSSFQPVAPIANLGTIGLLGAGAIGSGFAYTLWLSGWRASLEIIDKDFYDEPNHETTLVIGLPEVRRNRTKAIALAELIRRPGLGTTSVVEEIIAGSSLLAKPTDVFVCAVDNAPTRRILDCVNTRWLLNAGVGGRSEDAGHVLCSRHLPGEELLSARYKREVESESNSLPPVEFRDECSRLSYQNASLAAPFIGLAAGALLATGCAARILRPIPPAYNYFKIDMLRLQGRFQTENRQASPDLLPYEPTTRGLLPPLENLQKHYETDGCHLEPHGGMPS